MPTINKIKKSEAVAVFKALGVAAAGKWPLKRLNDKVAKLDALVEPGFVPDDTMVAAKLEELLDTLRSEGTIQVVGDNAKLDADPAPADDAPADDAPADDAPADPPKDKAKRSSKRLTAAEKAERKAAREAAAAAADGARAAADVADAPAPAADTPAKSNGLVGVRKALTRPYLAGQIIQEFGLEVGVTDEMVALLDERFGKANPTESGYRLREAWHNIRGYLGDPN